ncbi:MAG TPA: hypothetical protein VFS33_11605 [Gemmatimonadales bacterium]|nr:hypothetical protein [Gemmatimonadales bacterium]
MRNRFQLQYRGRRYSVERGRTGSAAATGGGAPVDPDRWYITLGGAALTALHVRADESEAALRGRVRQWVDAHPDLLDRDHIHMAGG